MKKFAALCLALMVVLSICACSKTTPVASSKETQGKDSDGFSGEFRIGIALPLSGANQLEGEYYLEGARLAAEEINASGGILGKKVVLVQEDCGTNDQDMGRNSVLKLIDDGLDVVIGSWMSANCLAVLPDVAEEKVILYVPGSSDQIVQEKCEFAWMVRVPESLRGGIYSTIAFDILGMKHPYVFSASSAAQIATVDGIVETAKERGVEITDKQLLYYAAEETNFSTLLAMVTSDSACDGVITTGGNTDTVIAQMRQMYDAGIYNLKLCGSNHMGLASVLSNVSDEVGTGWTFVADWNQYIPEAEGEFPQRSIDFELAYRERWGRESQEKSVWAYDCVYLTKLACEAAGTTEDITAINNGLKTIDCQLAGNYYRYDENGLWHVLATSLTICKTVEGKKVVPVQVVDLR